MDIGILRLCSQRLLNTTAVVAAAATITTTNTLCFERAKKKFKFSHENNYGKTRCLSEVQHFNRRRRPNEMIRTSRIKINEPIRIDFKCK